MKRDYFEHVPNEILEKIFTLTDKSTYYTSRLISKKFSLSIPKPENQTKKSLVLQSAEDGNLNLLKLHMRYYRSVPLLCYHAGLSGNQDVINFSLQKSKHDKSLFYVLQGALSNCRKDAILSCLKKESFMIPDSMRWKFSQFIIYRIDTITLVEILFIFSKVSVQLNVELISVLLSKFGFGFICYILHYQIDHDRLVCGACWKMESIDMFQYARRLGYEYYTSHIREVKSKDFANTLLLERLISRETFLDFLIQTQDSEILDYKVQIHQDADRIFSVVQKFSPKDIQKIFTNCPIFPRRAIQIAISRGNEYLQALIQAGIPFIEFRINDFSLVNNLVKFTKIEDMNDACLHHSSVMCSRCSVPNFQSTDLPDFLTNACIDIHDDKIKLPYMDPKSIEFVEKCISHNIWLPFSPYISNPKIYEYLLDTYDYPLKNIFEYIDVARYYLSKHEIPTFTKDETLEIYNRYCNKDNQNAIEFLIENVKPNHYMFEEAIKVPAKKNFRFQFIEKYLENPSNLVTPESRKRLEKNYPQFLGLSPRAHLHGRKRKISENNNNSNKRTKKH